MKQGLTRKLLAFLLVLTMVLSLVPVTAFAEETAAEEETLTVQDILGEKWYVSWNGGAVDATEYLNIVEGGAHGNFALRIGHPTQATEMTLRYDFKKADLGVATGTALALCLKLKMKLEGTLKSGSWVSVTNNVNGAAGNNRNNFEGLENLTSEWSEDYFSDIWCDGTYDGARLEFAISLDAGHYFYVDDMRAYGNYSGAGAMKGIDVMQNGSFEKWYGSYNETALYTQDSDFVRIVDGGNGSDHALQLGSADKATNYTLQFPLRATKAGTYSFDLWAKTEGAVTAADFTLRNGFDGASTTYSLAGVGADWTHIEHAAGVTDVAVDAGTLVLEIHAELPAGSYLYIDDLFVVLGYSNDLINRIGDGGFEGVSCLHYYDTTWESAWNEVQKKLGEKWNVSYNAGKLASAEYLSIVEGGTHGNFALRIGHPTERTELQLNYNFMKADLGVATGTSLGLNAKFDVRLDGTLNTADSWIRMIERNSDGTKNNLATDKEAAINSEWSKDYFIDVWADGKATGAQLQFAIVLEAGNYLYLDNIRTYGTYTGAGTMKNVNVMQNGSFEKWDCVWNAQGEASNGEFASIVEDPMQRSAGVLRLGHPEKETNYTLQLPLAVPSGTGYSFDLWARTEGEITDAAFELFDGTTAGARRRYSLTDVGADWTHIAHTYDVTDVWVDSGTLLVQIYVYMPAGSYLYLDDINIVRGNGATYSYDYINRLCDGMFRGYALGFKQPEKPVEAKLSTYVGAHKAPAGWYCTWEGEEQYRSNYLSDDAHSGNYALAMGGVESALDYTIAHAITLEEGAEYTFEGWFKKVGDFTYLSLMNGSTFKSLKSESIPTWKKYTTTFTASSTKNFSIFVAAHKDSQLLVDDLVIYKSDDATKTNLLVNGDFETVASSASEMLKIDKAFTEMPVSVQAQIRLPAGAEHCGVILSNNNGKTGYTVGVNGNGQPYVSAALADGSVIEGVFTDVDVRTGEVVTLTVSNANGQLSCSVNGEVKQTLDVVIPAAAELYANAFAIAGDHTAANENYFAGDLISLSVNGAENELAFWNFEGLADPNNIADTTGNGYDALYLGEYFDELPSALLEKYAYSFVAVGDTQYTNRGDTQKGKDYMGNLYQWIIDNQQKYNIQAVMGMGDICDTSPDTTNETTMTQSLKEWQHAIDSIGKLHSAGIPYTLVKGNHDSIPEYPENDTTVYETYLKQLGYDTQIDGWYEEEGSLANSYITLTVGETDWLILTIDQNHTLEEIAWAASVVEAHPNHKVIVTTHVYLKANGEWVTSSDRCTMFAKDLWDGLIGQYENIEMVLCGHLHSADVVVHQRQGKGNNIVTEMLIDSQTIDKSAYTGNGTQAPFAMVTLLMFSEDGSQVMAANYATGKGKFYHANAVRFIDASDAPGCAHSYDAVVTEPTCTEDGYTTYTCSVCGDSYVDDLVAALGHSYGEPVVTLAPTYTAAGSQSKTCSVCGDTVTEELPVLENPVSGYNVALDDNIALNFVLEVAEGDTVAVTVNDVPVEYTLVDGKICIELAAAQMTDVVAITVNGMPLGKTYSVRGYADTVLAGDYDDATKNLVNAMLAYGGAAQTFFDYHTGAMASDGITPPAANAIPEDSGMVVTDTIVGIDFYGASLLMKSRTAIRYYFTAEDITLYTFTDGNGNALTPVASNDMYYVQVNSINPAELSNDITVLVTVADSDESLSVTYNAISYMARKFYHDTTAQTLKDLVQAMYDYHMTAKAMVAGDEPATIGPFQQWSCIWNGSTTPTGEFVQLVSEEAHTGEYALRIGHPTQDTALTLQIQLPLEQYGSYEYDAWLKAVGQIGEETTVYIRDGANSPASGTKPYILSGMDLTDWTHIGNDDGDGNKTSIWLGNESGVLAIDILAVLPAGSYLYVDDLNVYEMQDNDTEVNVGVSLIENASFEKWDITYHAGGGSSGYDHVQIVDDVAKNGQKSLRIGHPTEYTEMTLELLVPLVGTEQCAELATWVKIDGQVTEGSGIYIRNGKTGAGGGNICFVPLDGLASGEWTYIYNNEPELQSSIWAPTGTVAINLLIGCEPGNYIYFDDLTVRKMWLSSYIDEAPNLIGDPGFENTDFSDAYNRPAAPFASNMVLQRNASVPVHGTGNDGDVITVTFAGQTKTATVVNGQWRVDLDPMEASTEGRTMVVQYPERLFVFHNVLVGEVWLASGQSNMALQVQQLKEEAQTQYAAVADNDLVRLYNHPAGYAQVPQVTAGDVSAWAVSSAESIGPHSAIGAAFGLRIQQALGENIPVGIVVTANGGTFIEQWLDQEHLDAAGGKSVDQEVYETLCYNYQVAQMAPFRFAGALWYQGCNNCSAGNIEKYPALFNALVEQWRGEFECDMPFIVFQLVQYGGEPNSPFGEFRVMQWDMMQTTENVYTVVGLDHGEADDIHPSDKLTYGSRAGDLALNVVYGQTDKPALSPSAVSAVKTDNTITVSFENVGGGLLLSEGTEVANVEVMVDGVYQSATATLVNDQLVVDITGMENCTAVSYGVENVMDAVNLYSQNGLPVAPFIITDFAE